MGYYTTIFCDVHVSKVTAFRKEVSRIRKALENADKSGEVRTPNDWFYYYWDISDADGYIQFSEQCRKWYEEDKFYNWLLQFEPEGFFVLIGESLDVEVVVFSGSKWKRYDIHDMVQCVEKHKDEFSNLK